MPSGRVHVVGSINVDVALPVEHLPAPGATIFSGDPVRSGGGKGANAAVAAARDGADVRLVAAVGRDPDGQTSLAELEQDGVRIDTVAVLDDRPTGLAMICVDAAAENFVVVSSGANAAVSPAHVAMALADVSPGDVCVVNFEIPEAAAAEAVERASRAGAQVLVNPSPVRPLDALVAARPVLVANAGEVRTLTGLAERHDASRAVLDQGCAAVVVTLGGDGVEVLDTGGDGTFIPAFPAAAVDTTGAGDTFTGVLAGGLARGHDLVTAARRAAAAAALSTQGMGARAAMPRRPEVDRLLASS